MEKSTQPTKSEPFLSNILEIRKRAHDHVTRGAITPSYQGDIATAIKILNEALATEIVCVLRYSSHFYMADGIQSESVKLEFREHAAEEQRHADLIAGRIKQLGGTPNLNPKDLLSQSHAEFQQGATLVEMIKEDLIAERIAIESYREMIQYFGENDPTSRRLMEEILAKEEEHAEELSGLLQTFDPRKAASNQ